MTGGAGFIGSHLVQRLAQLGNQVRVIDNLSSGRRSNIATLVSELGIEIMIGDILKESDLQKALRGCESVFHMAANPEVRIGVSEPTVQFDQNVVGTYKLLEAMRSLNVPEIHFASTSAVYGDEGSTRIGRLWPLAAHFCLWCNETCL